MSLAGSQEGVPAYTLTSFANVPEFAKHRTGPGRTEGKCGSREVELFIPDFLPSPNPTRGWGGLGRVMVISLYAFLRGPPGHILLLW